MTTQNPATASGEVASFQCECGYIRGTNRRCNLCYPDTAAPASASGEAVSGTLESLAAQLVAEFPMAAIVRAFDKAAPGLGAALTKVAEPVAWAYPGDIDAAVRCHATGRTDGYITVRVVPADGYVPLYTHAPEAARVDYSALTGLIAKAIRSTGHVTNSDKWEVAEAVIDALTTAQGDAGGGEGK